MRELERRFPPEFRNRIDEVVLFAPLTHDEVREIAQALSRDGEDDAVEGRQDAFTSTDEALELIVPKGYSLAFGARFLKRFIDEQIKLPISAQWKDGALRRDGEGRRARRRTGGRRRCLRLAIRSLTRCRVVSDAAQGVGTLYQCTKPELCQSSRTRSGVRCRLRAALPRAVRARVS